MKQHLYSRTPTYRSWVSMKTRCLNPKFPQFKTYSKRGICPEWQADFRAFLKDMGERPAGTTLERVDNSKGYWPNNCVWASHFTQQNNRGNNIKIEFNGETRSVAEWASVTGIKPVTIRGRLYRGMPVKFALLNAASKNGLALRMAIAESWKKTA